MSDEKKIDPYGLEMVPTQKLIDELRKRSPDGFVLVYDAKDPDNENDWMVSYGKSFDRIMTLLKYAEWKMHLSWMEAQIDANKQDNF